MTKYTEGQLGAIENAIHAAVSFTYIEGEAARLRSRIALKNAMEWPLTDGEEERLKEIDG